MKQVNTYLFHFNSITATYINLHDFSLRVFVKHLGKICVIEIMKASPVFEMEFDIKVQNLVLLLGGHFHKRGYLWYPLGTVHQQ
jgi:hypothetical protein